MSGGISGDSVQNRFFQLVRDNLNVSEQVQSSTIELKGDGGQDGIVNLEGGGLNNNLLLDGSYAATGYLDAQGLDLFTGNESRLLGLGATGEGLELFGSDRQADTAFFNEVNQGDLFGRGGSDILGAFESQEASLFGGAGNDILASYQSHSTLSGGSGNDVFLAFNPGQDDHTTVRSGPGQNAIVSLTGRTTIEDSEASREAQNLLLHYSGQTDIARLNAQDAVEVAPVPLDALVQNGFISQGMAQEIPSELAAWSNATLTLDGGTAAIDFGEGNVVSIGSYHSNSINGIIQRVNEQGGSVVVNSAPEPFDGGQVNTPGEEGNGGEEDNQSDLPGIFGP